MNKNMGAADRAIRIILAIVIGILYFTGRISGTFGIILGVVAIVFLVTSFMSWCPAYMPFGFTTCKKPDDTSGS